MLVSVEELRHEALRVVRIDVPRSDVVVATSDGTIKRRRLDANGKPECVPFLPSEIPSRLSDLGVFDASSQPVAGATIAELDPVERARLRQFAERFQGDRALRDLHDDELDGALGLTTRGPAGVRVPTLAGLLLIGHESSLRDLVPSHEVAFQVLDGEAVRLNEFSRAPLLRIFEWLETLFLPLNPEQEVQVGLFRVPVPRVDRQAFREAIANALTHRDYTRLGAVHVRLEEDFLVISNPGGFIEGVTLENLLTTEPRPRNPRLADAFKRIGLVERTGRGVDLIYRGLLRYGRARPDYSRSDARSVVLRMPAATADLAFLRMILRAEEQRGGALPIDSLIALACIRTERRASIEDVARAIRKDRVAAKSTVEALVEAGLVEAHGNTRARVYLLAAGLYADAGQRSEHTRQRGLDGIRHEEMVVEAARRHGTIRRADVMTLCHLSGDQAGHLLRRLTRSERLAKQGTGRWTTYTLR